MTDKDLTVDEIFEIGYQREMENKAKENAFKALDKLYDENGAALERLAESERKEFYRFFAVEHYASKD